MLFRSIQYSNGERENRECDGRERLEEQTRHFWRQHGLNSSAPTSTTAAVSAYPSTSSIVESKPDPRSSGFISVSTLRRAPISFPSASGSPATPTAPHYVGPVLTSVQRLAHKYPPNPQVEVKYNVKSACGGGGGRVTAVVSMGGGGQGRQCWCTNTDAHASKARGPSQSQRPPDQNVSR